VIARLQLLGAAVALSLAGGCHATRRQPPERVEFQRLEMGMPVRMVLYATDAARARLAAKTAFDRIRELNLIVSDYEDGSEINRLRHSSGSGRWIPVSEELWTVLRQADRLAHDTEGAFDITAGPLIQLWKRARRQRALPDPEKLAEAKTRVGYYYLDYRDRDRAVVLWQQDMRPDLGGIAKGFVMDQALKVLKQHGIRSALINAGGDMVMSGPPPEKAGWRIELPRLDSTNRADSAFIELRDAAFATSGDRYQFVVLDGKRYSHIVDPRTGVGLTDHSLVYVVARDGMTADALATACSVMEPEKSVRLVSRYSARAMIQRRPGTDVETTLSAGFDQLIQGFGNTKLQNSKSR
jgi:thiamine biosynthesis lipoprotein